MDAELKERISLLPRAQAISVGDSAFNDEQRQLIAETYKSQLGKEIPNCSCRNRYSDALDEIAITFKIKFSNIMNPKYRLFAGVIIWLGTECYSNANLTDEVAEEYLRRFPQAREKEFQLWPEETIEKETEQGESDAEPKEESVKVEKPKKSKKGK